MCPSGGRTKGRWRQGPAGGLVGAKRGPSLQTLNWEVGSKWDRGEPERRSGRESESKVSGMAAMSMGSRGWGPERICGEGEGSLGADLEPKERSREIRRRPGVMPSCSSGDFSVLGADGEGSCPLSSTPHATVLSCLQPKDCPPRSPRGFPFHSALPYLRSAEYLCSLPSSEPNQNSCGFCSSSGTLGRHRASIPGCQHGDESSSRSRGGLPGTDVSTYVEGLARAGRPTGAANISPLAPASTVTVIISGGINIPAGNRLQGHRVPDVTEGRRRRPGAVRGRAEVRTHFSVPGRL